MSDVLQTKFSLIRDAAIMKGLEPALSMYLSLKIISNDEATQFRNWYHAEINEVGKGGPVLEWNHEGWYPGAQDTDPTWSHFKTVMEREGKTEQIPPVHTASDKLVSLTPDPSDGPRTSRGLVVGYIQSGKTTNFTAVAAKLADLDYRMVIVLAGIHNALRKQTQDRLYDYLIPENKGRWFALTGSSSDFDLSALNTEDKSSKLEAASYIRNTGKTSLLVVKKNHVVLKKLLKWLSEENAVKALKDHRILIIDDEADQASVATRTINPLIREILSLMPRSTYIGYTATPFANVFINPHDGDDLYPRDFIYSLPQPEGYFGPEVVFGRSSLSDDEEGSEGYDMIRIIPAEDEFLLRPQSSDEVDSFVPVLTSELKNAISWYLLATAARWHRGGPVNSSMLIHTSLNTNVHRAYEGLLKNERERIELALKHEDFDEIDRLKRLWESETSRVPSEVWGRTTESFEEISAQLLPVLQDIRIIIDNSRSEIRLNYEEREFNSIIAVGGNTLSRGITLEGLVSSLFLRPTNTYDTLLQMGRWFGFRNGYEDLPRIWTTSSLRSAFRHLALVEHEMRSDIAMYELQKLTPLDAGVRIRTHPSLRITAKMGAASPAATNYSGARLQVRLYKSKDLEWLQNNWDAGLRLIQDASRTAKPHLTKNGDMVYKGVHVGAILRFLDSYDILEGQPELDKGMLEKYIMNRNGEVDPSLIRWNVAISSGSLEKATFGTHEINFVNRAPLADDNPTIADIGTLMTPRDLIIDLSDDIKREAKFRQEERGPFKEHEMKLLRMKSNEAADRGLIVLYPIDRYSKPTQTRARNLRRDMEAMHHILGLGIVFPQDQSTDAKHGAVRSTHVAVDPTPFPEEAEIESEIFEETGE